MNPGWGLIIIDCLLISQIPRELAKGPQLDSSTLPRNLTKDLLEMKSTKVFSKMLLLKSSDSIFYFFTRTLPDYVFHDSPKEFWKKSHFENMRAGFNKGQLISKAIYGIIDSPKK